MTTRVAIYARVSKDDNEQNPDNQLIELRRIAEHRGMTIYREYVDESSGKSMTKRTELLQMLIDAEKHRFDAAMVIRTDRLSRSTTDAIHILNRLNNCGVQFISTSEGMDTTTAFGKMLFQIVTVFAELEVNLNSERTKAGIKRTRAEGTVLGRPKATLSNYQIEKAKEILKHHPNISQRALASKFEGINRNVLIRELKKGGVL